MTLKTLSFTDPKALLPCIVQNALSGKVLMLGYMNQAAYEKTLAEHRLCFYSRSRQQLWIKGETSGNVLTLLRLSHDCDTDCLLAEVLPAGPTCHTLAESCFDAGLITGSPYGGAVFERLMQKLKDRQAAAAEDSYTQYLLRAGLDKILKKIAEEAGEVIIAAKNPEPQPLIEELSDLIYHTWVLMLNKGVELNELEFNLNQRLNSDGNLKK